MADEFTLALRWLRAKRHIDELLERPSVKVPDDEYLRGFDDGRKYTLMELKSHYFMNDEEAAESWRMRKEMGF